MYDPEDYEGDRDLDAHPELEPEQDGDVSEFDDDDMPTEGPEDHFRDDVEADADALASAGYGTDEDYGCYDGGFYDGGDGLLD